jgi:8-oxo-dGTP pyrophosphatase MutT (NUDIX family)
METNLSKIIKCINPTRNYGGLCGAGGIIYDHGRDKVLVVKGKEKWSLPKGHKELDEKPYETAMREIYEETSLQLKLDDNSTSRRILKCIYFLVSINESDKLNLVPIDTNEVEKLEWCSKYELFSKNCNKQLKYVLRNWSNIINSKNFKTS